MHFSKVSCTQYYIKTSSAIDRLLLSLGILGSCNHFDNLIFVGTCLHALYFLNIKYVTYIMGQIFCSRGRPVEQFYWTSSRFQGTSNRNSTGRPVEIFIAFLDEISNSKTFEANLQNSSGRPVESYWTSSRIQRTSNRSSTGRPLEQKIWANVSIQKHSIILLYTKHFFITVYVQIPGAMLSFVILYYLSDAR